MRQASRDWRGSAAAAARESWADLGPGRGVTVLYCAALHYTPEYRLQAADLESDL